MLRRGNPALVCHRVSIEFYANHCFPSHLYSYVYPIYSSADGHVNRNPITDCYVYD